MFSIYKIINNINGKIYIGKTSKSIEHRFKRHKYLASSRVNRRLYDSMRKHGCQNFNIHTIETVSSYEEADIRECYWIKFLNSQDKNIGYNMTLGGGGGDTFSNNPRKEEIRNLLKAKKWSDEQRSKFIKSMTGKSRPAFSIEWRKNISKVMKLSGRKPPLTRLVGEQHGMYGKNHTDEAKQRMSAFRKGKTFEQIYGREKAFKTLENMRERSMGVNNPFYKNISYRDIALSLMENPEIKVKLLAEVYSVSRPTMAGRIKDILQCSNIQRFRHITSHEDIRIILTKYLENIVDK